MLFTKSAAQRILDGILCTQAKVLRVRELKHVVLVVFEGGARFVSKNCFKADFIKFRSHGADFIKVVQYQFGYGGYSALSDERYYDVNLRGGILVCECADWKAQDAYGWKKPVCKHTIAIMRFVGASSIKEFIERKVA